MHLFTNVKNSNTLVLLALYHIYVAFISKSLFVPLEASSKVVLDIVTFNKRMKVFLQMEIEYYILYQIPINQESKKSSFFFLNPCMSQNLKV